MEGFKMRKLIGLGSIFRACFVLLLVALLVLPSLPIDAAGKVIDKELTITHTYPSLVAFGETSYTNMYFTFELDGDVIVVDSAGNKLLINAYKNKPVITQDGDLVIQDFGGLQIIYDFSRKDNRVKITYKGDYKGQISIPVSTDTSRAMSSTTVTKASSYEVGTYSEDGTLIQGLSYDWSDAKGVVSVKDNKIEFTTNGVFDIDPSVVGACGTDGSTQVGRVSYRKVFYASGNHWVFYSNGSTQGYRSSLDGVVWSNFNIIGTGSGAVNTEGLTVCFDGVNFHYVRESPADSDLYYRMGLAETNGSITWLAAENKVKAGTLAVRSICVNSSGYPVIGYQDGTYEWVITSSTKNGTWTTDVDTKLSTTSYWGLLVSPLTNSKLYAMYFTNDNIYGRLWNGSAWEAQITITTRNPFTQTLASVTSVGDSIYLTYLEGPTDDIRFVEYNGSSWGDDTLILALANDWCSPAITLKGTAGDLRIFWTNTPTNNHIYYITRTSGTWDISSTDWITDADTIPYLYSFAGTDQAYNGITGVVWVSNASSPYYVKYAFLDDNPPKPYLTTSSGVGGNVTTPGEGTYSYNGSEVVNISATADACYHFVNWTGNTSDIGNVNSASTNISMGSVNKSATANFAITQYTLTYTNGSNGTTTGTLSQTVNCGSNGTVVTAVPNAHYHFVNWNDSSTQNPRTDTNVSVNISVTDNFAIDTNTVTYTAGAHGSVNGSWPENVNYGSDSSWVLATADPCYHFVNWNDASTDNPRQETNVTSNLSFTTNFAITVYDLTTSSTSGGDVTTPGEGVYPINCGDTNIVATSDLHYHFVNWTGDVGTVDNSSSVSTHIGMDSDYAIVANFAIDTYTLTYNAGANGSIVGTSPQTVNYGDNGAQVTATPDLCYYFVNWSDGVLTAARTDLNITGDKTVTANFALDSYTFTYTAGAHGTINGTSPQMVNCGDNGSEVLAEASACYHFVNWSDSSIDNPRTDLNASVDITITANFAIDIFTLTIASGGNGSVTTPGESTYNYNCGQVVPLTAVPDIHYLFGNWTGDVTDIADINSSTTTITMTANASIQANFVASTAIFPPTNLSVVRTTAMCFNISWVEGFNSIGTLLIISEDIEPTDCTVPDLGNLSSGSYILYNGSGTSLDSDYCGIDTDMHEYYITAWGYDGSGNYSVSCTNETIGGASMATMILFFGWIVLSLALTFLALKVKLILFRLAPALSWTGLGIWLLIGDIPNLGMSDTWVQMLGFVFVVMAIGSLLLQIKSDSQHEKLVRGRHGAPGAESERWEEWGPTKKRGKSAPSSAERQAAYRMQVRGAVQRGEDRRRAAAKRNAGTLGRER